MTADRRASQAELMGAIERGLQRPRQPVLRVFVGYDVRERVAFHVLAHSILRLASIPIAIVPLALSTLGATFRRPRDPSQSTDFAYTRFLVPYLSNYQGLSIFMDCDMLVRVDLAEVLLYPLAHPDKAVFVVPHDYTPRRARKFLGQPQAAYPRKNWSSFIVFNNERCQQLTPALVQEASGAHLHRLAWLRDDEIGHLPLEWNYLVDEDHQATVPPKVVHFTNGTPCFDDYATCEFAGEWQAERAAMMACELPQETR